MLAAALVTQRANAGDLAVKEFQRAAYEADFSSGIANLKEIAAADPDDREAVFGQAILKVLAAFDTFHRDILVNSTGRGRDALLGAWARPLLPFAPGTGGPLYLPPNPNAKPMTYRRLREILKRFSSDLGTAETALAKVGDAPVKLPFKPLEIAIDLDRDGKIAPGERLFAPFLASARGWDRAIRRPEIIETELAFDNADASWLRGYTNLFLASANALLALDFERSYEASAHHLYGLDATGFGRQILKQQERPNRNRDIQAEIDTIVAELSTLSDPKENLDRTVELRRQRRDLPREAFEERRKIDRELAGLQAERGRLSRRRRELSRRRWSLEKELKGRPLGDPMAGVLDAVAFIHVASWKVIDRDRLEAARQNLLAVMRLNENTWRLARAETDNDREWLPNAKQIPPFEAPVLSDEIIDSWLMTTRLAEDVLAGRKLLPHPRFRQGVNLRTLLANAEVIDPVLIVTGHMLVPYLEDGDIVDQRTWSTLTSPMGRNWSLFAAWFN